jgi:hypothetical protein
MKIERGFPHPDPLGLASLDLLIERCLDNGGAGDRDILPSEAESIITLAEEGGVSSFELQRLHGLVSHGVPVEGSHTMAFPELRGDAFYMSRETVTKFEDFFQRHTPQAEVTTEKAGKREPTAAEWTVMLRDMFERAQANGTARPMDRAPALVPGEYPSYDISPQDITDLNRQAFLIDGYAYVHETGNLPEGHPGFWYSLGRTPIH